jgi:hypothetical protein
MVDGLNSVRLDTAMFWGALEFNATSVHRFTMWLDGWSRPTVFGAGTLGKTYFGQGKAGSSGTRTVLWD